MRVYDLELMGLQIALRTPSEITISENLRPFVKKTPGLRQLTVALELTERLPVPSPEGVWRGLEYYDRQGDTSRRFHCVRQGAEAFAVTSFLKNGDILLQALPGYGDWFSGSEGIFNRIGLETMLLQQKGLLLHASLIKYEGRAIAFAGASGVGKSTQAGLWERYLSAQVLNGDRAALRKTEEGWIAYGAPCAGTSGIYKNDSAPLAAILLLSQGAENVLRPAGHLEALRYLYPELSIHGWDKEYVRQATDLCLELLAQTPVYFLQCLPDQSAVAFTKKGLGL